MVFKRPAIVIQMLLYIFSFFPVVTMMTAPNLSIKIYIDILMFDADSNFHIHMISFSYTYVLQVSKNMDMTDAEAHECTKPPLVVDTLDVGIIYHVAVALKDANGYLSLWSQTIRVEKPMGKMIIFILPCGLRFYDSVEGSTIQVGVKREIHEFSVQVDVHQQSVLSLFTMILENLKDFRTKFQLEIMSISE